MVKPFSVWQGKPGASAALRVDLVGLLFTIGALAGCRGSLITGSTENANSSASSTMLPTPIPLPVVVELFTSQGCSSCPAADRVLAELEPWSRTNGLEVLPLSFHVDYWNHLGWRDPFSTEGASQRQRWYAQLDGQRGVYTPQIVVAGRTRLVGSKRNQVLGAISVHRGQLGQGEIRLQVNDDQRWVVEYRAVGLPLRPKLLLQIALTQDRASNTVRTGENAGSGSEHVAVVRDFVSLPDVIEAGEAEGTWTVGLPLEPGGFSVVAYAQEAESGAILAATREPVRGR